MEILRHCGRGKGAGEKREVYLSGPATAMLVAQRGFNTETTVAASCWDATETVVGEGQDRESIAERVHAGLGFVQEESLVLLSSWQRAERALCLHGGCTV